MGFHPAPASALVTADFRSTSVVLTNNSDLPLILTDHYLQHGCWETEPPARIEPGKVALWKSVSCGAGTGTEGSAFYRIDNDKGPNLRLHWDNAAVGGQSYDETVPNGYALSRDGGDGDHTTVNYAFDCNSRMCDGIPDDWKLHGVDIDPGDGSPMKHIDLPGMGADVNRPDIFVHLDWMADDTPGNVHSHQLSAQAIKRVVDAFANAPYQRRGAPGPGINLHVDAGPDSILDFSTGRTWGALSRARQVAEVDNLGTFKGDCPNPSNPDPDNDACNYVWDDFYKIKTASGGFVSAGRSPVFHYALSAHLLAPGSSWNGYAPRGASDFVLALGNQPHHVGTEDDQAGILMHELGHNLSLDHGGGDAVNFKPQYFSVMNYSYGSGMTSGPTTYIDYSRVATGLDENRLDENTVPPTGTVPYGIRRYCAAVKKYVTTSTSLNWVDWNCDGNVDQVPVPADIDGDGAMTSLAGYDDWAHLKLTGGAIGHPGMPPLPEPEAVREFDDNVARLMQPPDTTAPVTTATADPPPNDAGWNNTDVTVTLGATDDISGTARTEYDIDGNGWTGYAGPILLNTPGSHVLSYRSIDRAQNIEDTKTLPVRIDRTPPITTATISPNPNPAGWINADGTVTLTATDDLSAVAGITYSTTGAQATPLTTVPGDTVNLKIDQEGETVLTFHATDHAGNAETDKTLTVRLDRTPPVSTFTTAPEAIFVAVPAGGPHDDQYITGTATDTGSGVDHVDLTFTSQVPGPTLVQRADLTCTDTAHHDCTWRVRPPSGLGIYRATSTATDTAGNAETPGPGIHVIVVRTNP
ncbi:OmpL47-type beta-barrel domain-containing protein [Kitasatospora sp. NPDC059599]|uniref:OmpL47-type beta-barrel domain-containing protein n=1 Tax=Kitasatospora sp. NPDC059599 TaxID=3346880 RepID=UPI0036C01200